MKLRLLLLILGLTITPTAFAQLLQWNTFGNAGTETTEPSVYNNPYLNPSSLSLGPGVTPVANPNRFGGNSWFNSGDPNPGTLANAVAGNDFIEFTVTPLNGYTFTPTSLVFHWDKSMTGPSIVTLRSSADGYQSNLGTITPAGVTMPNTIMISGLTALNTTTFRLYGYNASNVSGTGGFDTNSDNVNVTLNGTTAATAFTSQADGPWATPSTWTGNVVPGPGDNVLINHSVTVSAITRNPGTTTTISQSGTLAVSGTYAATSATTVVNGIFQIDTGGYATGSDFTYGPNGTLVFNNSSSTYGINNTDVFWPVANGPHNVTVANTGGIDLGTSSTTSRTVNGLFRTSAGVTMSNGSVLTINATAQLDNGGYFVSTPVYGNTSTLTYNTGGSYDVGNEWTANSITPGPGAPQNVTIQNNTAVYMPTGNRGIAGDLTMTSGSLTLNATSGDLFVAGNWNRAAGTSFAPNNRAVFFNGSATQVLNSSGTETFNYLLIQGSGTLQLANGTDVIVTAPGGLTLSSLNEYSNIDLNGRTLTLTGGGNVNLGGGNRKITSGVANGKLRITSASVSIYDGLSLQTDTNTIIDLQSGIDAGTGSLLTINGTLQINSGGYVTGNSPRYGSSSTLQYNSGANPYGRSLEWTSPIAAIGTIGLPANVRVSNNTTLNYVNLSYSGPKGMAGNLTIDSGSSFYMDYGGVSPGGELVIAGNLTSAGNMTLGLAAGDDLVIGGNISFTAGYSFDPKNRAVIFNKAGTQTLSATSTPTFHYVNMGSGATQVQLLGTSLNITAPAGGNAVSFGAGSILDLNGNTLTLGTAGIASAISGAGFFKGSSTSGLVLLGTGSTGILRFSGSSPHLATLTVNRQSAATAFQLGTALTVNSLLNLNNGLIDLNGNILTLESGATINGGSAGSFIIANATNSELRKRINAAGSFTFPVGDNAGGDDYSPATVTFTSGTFSSAYVGIQVRDEKHPNNIASTNFLSRYWRITSSGISGSINYSFTGTYVPSDINGTEANIKPGRYNGSTWTNIGSPIAGNQLTVSGLSTLPAINEFSAGDPLSDAVFFYRSAAAGGDWSSPSSWQVSENNATGWTTATTAPGSAASGIRVRSGFNISSSGTVTCDDLIIDTGASLTISGGVFTVTDGPAATDLVINGTLNYNAGNFVVSGTASAGPGAVYNHALAAPSLTLPTITWDPTSTCNITGLTNASPVNAINMGQAFGNLNWNNSAQGSFVNIGSSNFSVAGTLTVGPTTNTNNKLSLANTAGTFTNTINKLLITGGQFNGCGNSATVNLYITQDVAVTGGSFTISDGSGVAAVSVATDVLLSGSGKLAVISNGNSPNTVLKIDRDLILSDTATINLEEVSSNGGTATIDVGRDFICTSTSGKAVDFGTGTVTNNTINIHRHFSKSGTGQFYTTSGNSAKGFAFSGGGIQQLYYSGAHSDYTSYLIKSGSTVQLLSSLTMGGSSNPPSLFSLENGGAIDFGNNAIIAADTLNPRFVVTAGATLITSNTSGFGGTTENGSLQSFGSVNTSTAPGRIVLPNGVNYTFNGNTSSPFPNGTFGNIGDLIINADVVSNMTSNLSVQNSMTIKSNGSFRLLSANLALNTPASFTIEAGATFDNNGENAITGNGDKTIYGRFITRDEQGFVGPNTSITGSAPVLEAGSVVEYARLGDQVVQSAPEYKNLHISGSGTKTLANANSVEESVTISDSAVLNAQNYALGALSTNLIMTGTSRLITGGTGVRPSMGGVFSLGPDTTIEFTNTAGTMQTPRLNKTYANIDVTGTNFGVGSVSNGIMFYPNSTFKVRNGATFKLHNATGFTGSSTSAIESGNPTIVLEPGSTIEYAGANQTLTPSSPAYYNLKISGTGTKSITATSEVLVDNNLDLTSASLKIDSNKLLTVTNQINNTSTAILVENGGNLVQINDGVQDTGTIKLTRTSRHMDHDDYIYWGAPIQENMVPQFVNMDAAYMWELTGDQDGYWAGITTTVPGRGYITRLGEGAAGVHDYYFTGTPNNGIIHVAAVSYDNGATDATGNAILLGNPYPCAIDAATFIQQNADSIEGTIYFWTAQTPIENNQYTADDYASWNITGSTGTVALTDISGTDDLKPSGKIGAGQGFFARLKSNLGVTFNNSMRLRTTEDNLQFFRPSNMTESIERHRIWLNISNTEGGFRQMLLGYVTGATNGYESHYDGKTFTSNSINIYSISGDDTYVIQGRALPFDPSDTVAVGYSAASAGTHTISIDQTDGIFSSGQTIYLEDLLLESVHNLSAAPYTFTTGSGTFNDRFLIRYTDSELGSSTPEEYIHLVVTTSEQKIAVRVGGNTIQEVQIFDIRGRLINKEKEINSDMYVSPAQLSSQAAIVKVMLADGSWHTRKVIIQ